MTLLFLKTAPDRAVFLFAKLMSKKIV